VTPSIGGEGPFTPVTRRVLREAGLVEVQIDAQRRVYRLRTEPLREIDEWLAPYRAAWAGRLGALEAHLDDMDT
jgi:DNA-binding transcriptional ArsR family regulator